MSHSSNHTAATKSKKHKLKLYFSEDLPRKNLQRNKLKKLSYVYSRKSENIYDFKAKKLLK